MPLAGSISCTGARSHSPRRAAATPPWLPTAMVRAVYPGASAQVLEQTVAAPLENAINGVEGML